MSIDWRARNERARENDGMILSEVAYRISKLVLAAAEDCEDSMGFSATCYTCGKCDKQGHAVRCVRIRILKYDFKYLCIKCYKAFRVIKANHIKAQTKAPRETP